MLNDLTPYQQGRMARLLAMGSDANPFPVKDDGVSDWAVWNDGWIHIDEVFEKVGLG